MVVKRWIVGAALVSSALLAVCGAQPGTTEMTFNRGKTPPGLETVDEDGTYVLYPNNSGNALRRIKLREGDRFGFVQRGEEVVAVARSREKEIEQPLEARLATAYYWKMIEKDAE